MKRIAASLAAAVLVSAAALYGAASGADANPSHLPDVVVEAVALDPAGSPRGAGEKVRGVATVSNPTEYPAEAIFETGVVGGFDEYGLPAKVYAMNYEGENFSLAPGERAEVPFSVEIPAGLSAEDAAVQVQARLVGSLYLGWNYSEHFKISGRGGAALVEAAYFTLPDGREVPHSAGPTIYPKEPNSQLPLSIVLRGQGTTLTLAPTITAKNRAFGGASVRTLSSVKIPASGEVTAVVPVSAEGQEPGVYEGEVSWLDAAGDERAPRLGFRYIVAGQTATVHSVSSSADRVSPGDELVVTLSVSGTPIDLIGADHSREQKILPAKVTVELSDVSGKPIATASESRVLSPLGDVSLGMVASAASDQMIAQVTIYGAAGEEIFSRAYPLSAGKTVPPAPDPSREKLIFSAAALLASALLTAAFFAWRRFRRRLALGAVLLAAGAWGFACYSSVVASGGNIQFTTNEVQVGWIEGCTGPNIYVNSPMPGSSHSCGTPLLAQARVQYSYCANSSNYGSTQLWLQKQGVPLAYGPVSENSYSGGGSHTAAYFDGVFSLPLPGAHFAENGNYGIWIKSTGSVGGDGCSWNAVGVRPFKVTNCDQCPNVDGVQAAVPAGMEKDAAGNCALPDVCANLSGAQSSVPSGMVKNAGGDCVCGTGTSFDAATGRCVCAAGSSSCDGGGGGTGCPIGQKYCDGVCVAESVSCDTVTVDACPLETDGEQYCVQLFNADGSRTDQLAGYGLEELEQIFGAGIRLAVEQQQTAAAEGSATYSIWGVPGRAIAGANETSSGCAGTVCSYGREGCLTAVDLATGDTVGQCSGATVPGAATTPDAMIEVEPSLIGRGGRCEVFWSSHAVTSCQVTGPGISSAALAGKAATSALNESAVYQISCVGKDGQTYRDVDTCSVDPNAREF